MDYMGVQRLEGKVIGPGAPGTIRVRLGPRETVVPLDVIPPELRVPNSQFVAVMRGGSMLRVEPESVKWKQIMERIRTVLNSAWDPIGVSGEVSDEYDGYVGGIYSIIIHGAADDDIAERLLRIEVDAMGLEGSSPGHRAEVVRRLRALALPRLSRSK